MSVGAKIGVAGLTALGYSASEASSLLAKYASGNSRVVKHLDSMVSSGSRVHAGNGPVKPAGLLTTSGAPLPHVISGQSYPSASAAASTGGAQPASNRGFGVMGALGMVGIGMGVGGLTAAATGGNVTPGALWGGALGGGVGMLSSKGMVSHASSMARNIPMIGGSMSEGNLRRGATAGMAAISGYALSGNRGDDKRRGFNAKRGNKISSSRY
jgi:hypothetical protein